MDTPQFIVLTNDDSVSSVTYPVIRNITDRHKNRNGCVMPATWFVQTQFTDANLIMQLYMDNHEIATHTVTHPSLPNASEIVGARKWLNEVAKVPLDKLKGFRAPFLVHDTEQRNILRENGFTYDRQGSLPSVISITDSYGDDALSPTADKKVWPFTMDYGIPIDCAVGTGTCGADETQPGLWEFPLWNIQDENGIVLASMDPVGDNYEQYKREFDRNYNGDRAPLGLYLHAGLLMAFSDHQGQINDFLEYALSHDNVWVVTISEVLRWMKNPVPASQYSLDCSTPTDMQIPGGKLCFEPSKGCDQGTWDQTACSCTCLSQDDPKANGYCPDSSGSCTIPKTYDDATGSFLCPGEYSDNSGAPGPAPSPSAAPGAATTPVTFGFYITVESGQCDDICAAVARVALENATNCEVTDTTDATGSSSVKRTYVEVTINSTKPDASRMALQSAAQYGALAASLKSVGIQFDSVGEKYATSPAPATAPSAGGSTTGDDASSGSGTNVGAIVGGVVGGVAGLAVAAATTYLVMRHLKKKILAGRSPPSSGAASKKFEEGAAVVNPVSVLASVHATGYNASPRSSATPRRGSFQGGSPKKLEHTTVSMQ
ncbi:hypothetical protein N2152v2_004009 [Parachlorella kessleri]